MVACGLPHYGRGDLKLARHEIAAAQQNFAGLRRYGAATLDLAWVAAGRLDAYWERDLSPWDLAAGMLLVREAGGFVTDLDGGDAVLAKGQVAAGNDTMHRELLRLLKEAGKEAEKEAGRAGKSGGNAVSCSVWPRVRHHPAANRAASRTCGNFRLRARQREIMRFSYRTAMPYCARILRAKLKPMASTTRTSQARLAPHLSGADAGVPDPVRR